VQVIDPQHRVLGQAVTGDEVRMEWPSPPHNSGITEACLVNVNVDVNVKIAESGVFQIILTDAHGLRRSSPYLIFSDLDGVERGYVFCVNGEGRCGARSNSQEPRPEPDVST
jgi:hypothetical protein